MTKVTPSPRLPHPLESTFAVPTMFWSKKAVVQTVKSQGSQGKENPSVSADQP
jgi:hypothetical protein